MDQSRASTEISPVQTTLRIVASCTQGKRYPVTSDLRLGGIPKGPLDERLAKWKDHLQRSSANPVAAADLYRGQHWAIVRDLPAVAQAVGYRASLWVASAGYGLVSAEAKIRPYSATFAGSEEDSIWRPTDGDRRTALRKWWEGLQALPVFPAESPRSLTALADATPAAIFLVIGSPAYIAAMADDLVGVRARLLDPQRLIVISSRDGLLPEWLASHVVPSEAPLSGMLGGSLGSLHARTARRILQEATTVPLQADVLVRHYSSLISDVESTAGPARLKMADESVRSFIREAIMANRRLSCTAALRKLRMSGQACEQRRFTGLYAEVVREVKLNAS
jgi:hypothetical protein